MGFLDSRHLWPTWKELIAECHPTVILGEQVAGPLGIEWMDSVALNLEEIGFKVAAGIFQAGSFGAPQERERTYFVAQSFIAEPRGWTENRSRGKGHREISVPWNSNHKDFEEQIDRYVLLADGLSSYVAKRCAGGFGNAIVPQVAAEFIAAFIESRLSHE
jgi:DNA (cytosine-5)-methyltransferase 1